MKEKLFDKFMTLGILSVILDGATAFTVNCKWLINSVTNRLLHALFLVSLDSVIFVLFLYMLHITGTFPKDKFRKTITFFTIYN